MLRQSKWLWIIKNKEITMNEWEVSGILLYVVWPHSMTFYITVTSYDILSSIEMLILLSLHTHTHHIRWFIFVTTMNWTVNSELRTKFHIRVCGLSHSIFLPFILPSANVPFLVFLNGWTCLFFCSLNSFHICQTTEFGCVFKVIKTLI